MSHRPHALHCPAPTASAIFTDAQAALDQVQALYTAAITHLRDKLAEFIAGSLPPGRVRACYPVVRVRIDSVAHPDSRLAYGFVAAPGVYETTLTRPDLFADYLFAQFQLLLANHGVALEIGVGEQPVPLHFSFAGQAHVEGHLSVGQRQQLRDIFDLPDLAAMDDGIANGTHDTPNDQPMPLALFTAPRIDYSLHRLQHYTGTAPEHFQNFVLFTNYQFYVDEFVRMAHALMNQPAASAADDDAPYTAFVEPGNVITHRATAQGAARTEGHASTRLPQMPAYHLIMPGHGGITLVNIGVGPANAKNITDHIAVLRPHAWIMLGHCAGLRNSQRLGDYVLAHGYVREDHVLDEELPLWVPIPPLAEVQQALEGAVADITQLHGYELKRVLRTGTVASTDNRNWELLPYPGPDRRFSQSRAIALDMESATVAANGFRFRVPYGTLLCVSDKPLHGELKLPGMADQFYRQQVEQHLRIGLRAIARLRQQTMGRLHSRKLRSFDEVAFQ
jgi:AMP nucleosidase